MRRVVKGSSDLDCSLVSGESAPQPASEGTALQAGTLNLTGPLTIVATAAAKDSFLAEMVADDGSGRRPAARAIAASPTAPRGSMRRWCTPPPS